jgi:acyl dehydratase
VPPTLALGQSHEIAVEVSEADVARYIDLSGDTAPIHTSPAFAQRHGFNAPLVHGAFLAALVSRLVGTGLPGPLAILQRLELAFREPCYAPSTLTLRASVRQVSEAVATVVLDISITDQHGRLIATGKTWHRMLDSENAS